MESDGLSMRETPTLFRRNLITYMHESPKLIFLSSFRRDMGVCSVILKFVNDVSDH